MKKSFLFFVFMLIAFVGWSQHPQLALVQAFDGRFNNLEGVKISEIQQKNNYYLSIKVNDNLNVINQLKIWCEETRKEATSIWTTIENGQQKMILNIEPGNINIGITTWNNENRIKLWIQSNEPIK